MRRFFGAVGLGVVFAACGNTQKTPAPSPAPARSAMEIPPALPTAALHADVVPPQSPSPSATKSAARCEAVKLEIKAVKSDGYTQFRGTLTNMGKSAVTLIEPGDGSDVGWRTPELTWTAKTLRGKPAPRRSTARCGNVNPLQDSEVFVLAPGEAKEIAWLGTPSVEPGRYVVRLVYENDPTHDFQGVPLGDPSIPTSFATSTPCRAESQAITVDL